MFKKLFTCTLAISLIVLDQSKSNAQDLVSEYWPALVLVRVYSKNAEGSIPLGYGTGWLVSYDGYLISAAHVITGNRKHSWKEVVLKGELWGRQYPIEVIDVMKDFDDLALLKLKWRSEDRAEKIFDQFQHEILTTKTPISILGFPNPDLVQPAIFTANISQSGGAKYSGDGPIRAGFSGSPAVVVADEKPYVVGVALGMTLDSERREVQGQYVPTKFLKGFLDHVKQFGDLQEPKPRWLPRRPLQSWYRLDEIRQTLEVLRKQQIVLLTGAPGTGSNEVATEIGYQAWQEMKLLPANVLYVTASSAKGEPKSLSVILERLVIQLNKAYLAKRSDEEKIDEIRNILSGPEHRLILLVDVENETDLQTILDLRGNNPVLVTSSSRLIRVSFDRVIQLSVLSTQDCVKLFKQENGLASINDKDVEEMCRLLGRNPEAVRVAAKLVTQGGVSVPSLLAQLRRQPLTEFPELAELTRAFGTAYSNLQRNDQSILKNLVVIGGESFDLRAANAVNGSDIELNLKRLWWLNLMEEVSPNRFRLSPIMRHVVESGLTDAEKVRALLAMTRYYLGEFGGSANDFQREWNNIIHALQVCQNLLSGAERRQCLRRGVPRVAPFMRYWGLWSTHQDWVARWYESARVDKDLSGQRGALGALMGVEIIRGNVDDARRLAQEASSLEKADTDLETANLYYSLAQLEFESSRRTEARALVYKGLEIAERASSSPRKFELQAGGYHKLGILAETEGEFDAAKDQYLKSIEIATKEKLSYQVAITYYQLGTLAFRTRQLEEANENLQKALAIAGSEHYEETRALSLTMLGRVSHQQKKPDLAIGYLSEAVVLLQQIGSRYLITAKQLLEEIRSTSTSKS